MISGLPIDEQRAQREVGVNQPPPLEPNAGSSVAGPSSLGGGGGDNSDDDNDPNDIVVKIQGPLAKTGAYSNLDESDYEPQSDDSD